MDTVTEVEGKVTVIAMEVMGTAMEATAATQTSSTAIHILPS